MQNTNGLLISNSSLSNNTPELLQEIIHTNKQFNPLYICQLLKTVVENSLNGTIQWQKNIVITLNNAIANIDASISAQLSTIMHHDKFSQLEGSWRGLQHLVRNTETGNHLRIRMLNVAKKELNHDLIKAVEFDQSQLFKMVYENEFGSPGGEPYSILIGDYSFSHHPEDIAILHGLSHIAAAGFSPFIAAADAKIMGFENWTELTKPRDLAKIFDSADYAQWRNYRDSDDSRFVVLTLPRVLARLPYGKHTQPIEEFHFEENPSDKHLSVMPHANYCWMNSAYVLGTRITNAFAQYGWCTAIRGAEGGGKITHLPLHAFTSDDGDLDMKCPTEVGITDRREAELSQLGFLPLCHYKNTDYAVFFGAETTQKPKKYASSEATANAAISARLPYLLATSRFSHYLKIMARDKIGSFMQPEDVEVWLNRWILNYVNGNAQSKQDLKAKYPLAEARITVTEIPNKPGAYQAIAWLRPWLQLEELTTAMRLVARIPKKGNA